MSTHAGGKKIVTKRYISPIFTEVPVKWIITKCGIWGPSVDLINYSKSSKWVDDKAGHEINLFHSVFVVSRFKTERISSQ